MMALSAGVWVQQAHCRGLQDTRRFLGFDLQLGTQPFCPNAAVGSGPSCHGNMCESPS